MFTHKTMLQEAILSNVLFASILQNMLQVLQGCIKILHNSINKYKLISS